MGRVPGQWCSAGVAYSYATDSSCLRATHIDLWNTPLCVLSRWREMKYQYIGD